MYCAGVSMTPGISLPSDSFKQGSMSIRFKNCADGKRSRWSCAMRTISRKVCVEVRRSWIDCGEKVAPS